MATTTNPSPSIFVDTSGWADAVLKNTSDHLAMEVFYKSCVTSGRRMITTNYILTELVALLTARSRDTREKLLLYVQRIKQMQHVEIVYVDRDIDDAAWAMLQRYRDKEWSLVDAASFVIMQRQGIREAFTSDHHLSQAGFLRVPQI